MLLYFLSVTSFHVGRDDTGLCVRDGEYRSVGQGWLAQASRMEHKPLVHPVLWKGRVKSC